MKTIFNNNYFLYIYNKNISFFFKNRGTVRLRQVFAEPNAIYFIATMLFHRDKFSDDVPDSIAIFKHN